MEEMAMKNLKRRSMVLVLSVFVATFWLTATGTGFGQCEVALIVGNVLDPNGQPLSDILIEGVCDDFGPTTYYSIFSFSEAAEPYGPPRGRYVIRVRSAAFDEAGRSSCTLTFRGAAGTAWRAQTRNIPITRGETTWLDVTMSPTTGASD